MSSLIICRILVSNYQANKHYNRAGAKGPIFLVMLAPLRNERLQEKVSFSENHQECGIAKVFSICADCTTQIMKTTDSVA